jgi:diguanylate cyclase (GGDEF)-like protein
VQARVFVIGRDNSEGFAMQEPVLAVSGRLPTVRRPSRDPAILVGVLLCAAGVAIIPFGTVPLPTNPSFMPAFGAVTTVVDLITCLLLFSQAKASRNQSTCALAIAYLFSALTILPHLAAFPGVFAQDSMIGGSGSAVWLWCVWHGGFAICVARYALIFRPDTVHHAVQPGADTPPVIWPHVILVFSVVAALTLLATAGLSYLPTILVGNGFGRLNALGIGPAVLVCNVAALLLVVLRLGSRSTLSRWLAVAMIASTFDVVLTLLGSGRFTMGWYAARGLSLLTGIVVLVALLCELTAVFARTAQANRDLEQLSLTDGLTGLPNRRAFDRTFDAEWRSARRSGTGVALLMIDIDHFKSFNDRFGHPVGDLCLRRVAQAIGAECRRGRDLGARYGGEEFAVLLPGTDALGARTVAELIRSKVALLTLEQGGTVFGNVTVSIGFAAYAHVTPRLPADALVAAADAALYAAKRDGRNRVAEGLADGAGPQSPPYSEDLLHTLKSVIRA